MDNIEYKFVNAICYRILMNEDSVKFTTLSALEKALKNIAGSCSTYKLKHAVKENFKMIEFNRDDESKDYICFPNKDLKFIECFRKGYDTKFIERSEEFFSYQASKGILSNREKIEPFIKNMVTVKVKHLQLKKAELKEKKTHAAKSAPTTKDMGIELKLKKYTSEKLSAEQMLILKNDNDVWKLVKNCENIEAALQSQLKGYEQKNAKSLHETERQILKLNMEIQEIEKEVLFFKKLLETVRACENNFRHQYLYENNNKDEDHFTFPKFK